MIVLIIMDGFGIRKSKEFNAIKLAKTPNLKKMRWFYPYTTLRASGEAVGLPEGVVGNSEAGHLTIGSGRVLPQALQVVNNAIADNSFFKNKALINAIKHAQKNGGALHIIGLLSSGGVHSSIEHIKQMMNMATSYGAEEVYLHCILDGRDGPVDGGLQLLHEIELFTEGTPCFLCSVIGRFYAMDRESQWERTETAYNLMMYGKGKKSNDIEETIRKEYESGIYDEFMGPIFMANGRRIQANDSVVFCNLRKDRTRQIVSAFCEPNFDKFKTKKAKNILLTSLIEYDDDFAKYVNVAFKTDLPKNTLGEVISNYGRRQLRVTETTKFPHVTYYFNGGRDEPFKNEYRRQLPTVSNILFDEYPRMRAFEITEKVLDAISSNKFDFILVNLSNCDMVGHTANLDATKTAVKTVDKCVGAIAKAAMMAGGECIITADHGNAEELAENGVPKTSHTNNPVPFHLVSDKKHKINRKVKGTLANIAPTVLQLMGLPIPPEMEKSLIEY